MVDVTVKDDSGKAITSGTFPVTYGVKQAVLTPRPQQEQRPLHCSGSDRDPQGTNVAMIVAAVAGVIIVILLVFVVLLLRKRRI